MKNIFQKFMALLLMVVISIVLAQIEMGSGIALAFALPVGFANLTYPCGEENMGGYMNRILFIPACSVSAVPELSTTEATTAADLVTAAGAFTFNQYLFTLQKAQYSLMPRHRANWTVNHTCKPLNLCTRGHRPKPVRLQGRSTIRLAT